MINLYNGVDRYEYAAYYVAAHSAMKRCSVPLSITPLYKHNLKKCLWRERHPLQSTDFSFSRFLVPYLSGYVGKSIFIDCDMLVNVDLNELIKWTEKNDRFRAVWCVKHDYVPKTEKKFLGQVQSKYAKKNWTSVMVFENSLCDTLTPEYVNAASGLDLHQLKWLENDYMIGELPLEWNWLVGEYEKNDNAKIYHWTLGTPCFDDYKNCMHADLWWNEFKEMESCIQEVQS